MNAKRPTCPHRRLRKVRHADRLIRFECDIPCSREYSSRLRHHPMYDYRNCDCPLEGILSFLELIPLHCSRCGGFCQGKVGFVYNSFTCGGGEGWGWVRLALGSQRGEGVFISCHAARNEPKKRAKGDEPTVRSSGLHTPSVCARSPAKESAYWGESFCGASLCAVTSLLNVGRKRKQAWSV